MRRNTIRPRRKVSAIAHVSLSIFIVLSYFVVDDEIAIFRGNTEHTRNLLSMEEAVFGEPQYDKGTQSQASTLAESIDPGTSRDIETHSQTEVQVNDPSTPPNFAKIYYCGGTQEYFNAWAHPAPNAKRKKFPYFTNKLIFVTTLFPEIDHEGFDDYVPLTKDSLKEAKVWDILLMYTHRWCDVDDLTKFPGRQIHFNAEYYDVHPLKKSIVGPNQERMLDYLAPGARTYTLGPHKDSDRSIRVPFVLMQSRLLHPKYRNLIFDPSKKPRNTKERFLLYVNSHWVDFREVAAHEIANKIAPIDVAGKCQGNIDAFLGEGKSKPPQWPIETPRPPQCEPFSDEERPDNIRVCKDFDSFSHDGGKNYGVFGKYRFALVMENVYSDGYITEKILNAFTSGSVPIYYGTVEIFDIFNKEAFIYYNITDPQPALDRISYLESNPDAYEKMLGQPILADGERTVEKYFSWSDDVGGGKLKKRIRIMMGYDS
mmetsp:Transcript_30511/g.62331  ORF Transcript_30511/g.62331 Transcript_30511/m.62331 type:complete len:485 (+) Transcript_30511:53-1507(+)